MEYKQLILMRDDLKLPKGKAAAQAAHAAIEAMWRAKKEDVASWRSQGMGKVVLKVSDEKELMNYLQIAKDAKFPSALITDAGHTVVEPGTVTCLGIGPAPAAQLDKHYSSLKLF